MNPRPIPPVTDLTQPYWDAAQQDQLVIQSCDACLSPQFPPRAHCAACGADTLSWQPVSGEGVIYTYTIAHRPPHPVFKEQCPLVIAVVELAEGPRLMSNIIDCTEADLEVGLTVHVAFEPIEDSDLKLPVFKLRSE